MGFDLSRIHSVLVMVRTLWLLISINSILIIDRFRKHKAYIRRRYPEHDRLGPASQSTTLSAHIQPVPAIIGLIGSLLIVFVFTTATWWSERPSVRKVAIAYGAVCNKLDALSCWEEADTVVAYRSGSALFDSQSFLQTWTCQAHI